MKKNEYTLINKFNCCGKTMATVIIKGKAACTITELEYNRFIDANKNFSQKNIMKIKDLMNCQINL